MVQGRPTVSSRQRHLERRPGVALYAALQEQIETLIATEGLGPGDTMPTEVGLCARFGVSRATVRQALAELERHGVIERHQGRGTFVRLPPMERVLPELTGFSEHVRARGMRPWSEVVEFRHVDSDGVGDMHSFPPGTPLVRVVRVRHANEVAVGIHTLYIPLDVADRAGIREEVLRADPTASLYVLLEQAGVRIAWAEEHLRARGADATEARLLGTAYGTPVMSVLRVTRDDRDGLIEAVRAVYLGDKYDYVVQLERRAGHAGRGGLVTTGDRPTEEAVIP